MGTLGIRLMEGDPENYGGKDPADLERVVYERLNDPARRDSALRELRRVFPKASGVDDEMLHSRAMQQIGDVRAATPPAEKPFFQPLTFGGAAAKESADIQRALSGKAGGQAYKGITKNVALRMSDPAESEASRTEAEAAARSTITPSEADDPRVRVGTWEDFQREMQKNPALKPVEVSRQDTWLNRVVGPMFPRVQLQDESGRAVMQMKPGASYPAGEVKGHYPALLTSAAYTGEADPIEQALVGAASRVYDPGRKEGERWGNVLTSPPAGRGLPEYGSKAMQAAAAADPTVDPLGGSRGIVDPLARGVNWLGSKTSMAPDALAYAAKKAGQFLAAPMPGTSTETSKAFELWSEQNADDLIMAQQELENEMRAQKPDFAKAGENIGYAARMVNPISASGALAAGAAKAIPFAREALKGGAQKIEKTYPEVRQAIRGIGASEVPSAMIVPGQQAQATMQGGIAAARAEGELLERRTQQEIKDALSKATGVTDPAELERLDRMALENWSTPEQRLAAVQQEPRLAAVYETLQPLHERTYRAAYPEGQYDPFKMQYGQNISMPNRYLESRSVQAAAEDARIAAIEQQLDVGSKLNPASLQGVPGFDQQLMQRATVDPVYAAEEARLLNEVQFYDSINRGLRPQVEADVAAVRAPIKADVQAIRDTARVEALGEEAKGIAKVQQLKDQGRRAYEQTLEAYKNPIKDVVESGSSNAKSIIKAAEEDAKMKRGVADVVRDARAEDIAAINEQTRLNILEQQLIAEGKLSQAFDIKNLAEWKLLKPEYDAYEEAIRNDLQAFNADEKMRAGIKSRMVRDQRDKSIEDIRQVSEMIRQRAQREAQRELSDAKSVASQMRAQAMADAQLAYGRDDISEAVKEYRALMEEQRRQGRTVEEMYRQGKQADVEKLRAEYVSNAQQSRESYRDLSRQLADLQKQGPRYSVVPRRGRALQELSARSKELNLSPKVQNEIENITATGGIARTFRRVREGQGLRQESLFRRTLVDDLPVYKEAKPKSFTDIGSYAIQHNINADIRGPGLVDWKREQIGKEMVDPAWQKVLRENDDVLLKVIPDEDYASVTRGLIDYGSRAEGKQRIIHYIPQSVAPKNVPEVVDRRVAQALEEAASPSSAMRAAQTVADTMEKLLASGQMNKAMTLGRPGFSARNRTNEIMRMLVHDPATLTDKTVLALSEEVSRAPIGAGKGRVVTELPPNPVTKRPYTTGELHELSLSNTGMGQGITQEGAGLGQELPQGFWGRTKMGAGLNRAIEAGMAPGVKFNEAVDEMMKQALMPGLAPEYKLEDGFRLRTFINELKNGVRPAVAGNTSRNLLIDFGDKNALQVLGKTVFPFIKYQSSAVPLVMELVAKNPQRYARTYQLAQMLERDDAERHGGTGINVKYKSLSDVMSGSPLLTDTDRSARALRPEVVGSEVASAIEGWGKVASGEESPASMAGPVGAALSEYFTGTNPARGRNVYGLDPDVFVQLKRDKAYSSNPLSYLAPRAYMAWMLPEKQDRERAAGYPVEHLGQNPRLTTAYQVLQGVPLLSRPLASEPWQLALRTYIGGSNPASRSQESTEQMLKRAAQSWLTGMRSGTVDYAQEYARQKGAEKQLAKPVSETTKAATRKGRIGQQEAK